LIRLRIEASPRERERESKRWSWHSYDHIISVGNLLQAWREFLRGKRRRQDVQLFSLHLTDNILALHRELTHKNYCHGSYQAFNINDPKPRSIHKASVRDRLIHHAVYRILYPYFNQKFIYDSYSCRLNKGTHRAINRLRIFGRKISQNNTRTVWVLKGDIRKFFASIDHQILINILKKHEPDPDIIWLLEQVIGSFYTARQGLGLPLGNLTSQLLVNIYMNEFDHFVKRKLKEKFYIRYADDFVILGDNRKDLLELIPKLSSFLLEHLKLTLHPNKVFIKTLASGVDFLGWTNFPHHRVLRFTTRRRVLRKIKKSKMTTATIASYKGLLIHGNTYKLRNLFKQ